MPRRQISAKTHSQLEKQRLEQRLKTERQQALEDSRRQVSTTQGRIESRQRADLEVARGKPAWTFVNALLAYTRRQRDAQTSVVAKDVKPDGSTPLVGAARREFDRRLDEVITWERRVSELENMEDRRISASVRYEPRTYNPHGEHSFFRDLSAASSDGSEQALEANNRLERHMREVNYEIGRFERSQARAERGAIFEQRTNPNRAPGFGGNFAPPLWLIEEFAVAPRPGRVLTELVRQAGNLHPLPDGVSSVNVPRIVQGTLAAQLLYDDTAPSTVDLTDAAVSSPAVTITGMVDASLQLLEQSPRGAAHLDQVIFRDLTSSYDASLEAMLINAPGGGGGPGAGGQLTGLLAVAGANTVTYTSATPNATAMYGPLAQLAAQVGDARSRPPECWLMRTARWAWLGAAEDADGRPLSLPGHFPSEPLPDLFDDSRPTPVAPLLGWPIYLDDSIPAALGAGSNQDVVISVRPSDLLIWESSPRLSIFPEPLSGTLGVRLQMHGYVAAILARYPSGIGVLNGTGLVVQSGW